MSRKKQEKKKRGTGSDVAGWLANSVSAKQTLNSPRLDPITGKLDGGLFFLKASSGLTLELLGAAKCATLPAEFLCKTLSTDAASRVVASFPEISDRSSASRSEAGLLRSSRELENSSLSLARNRAKSAVRGTRVPRRPQKRRGQRKTTKRKRKGPETAPWPVSITRLLWLRQWRTLFLAGRRRLFSPSPLLAPSLPLSLSPSCLSSARWSATASETAQREHRRSRLSGFLTTSLISTASSPTSLFFTRPTSCSPRPSRLPSHKFTRPLRPRSTLGSESAECVRGRTPLR